MNQHSPLAGARKQRLVRWLWLALALATWQPAQACIRDDRPRQHLTLYPTPTATLERPAEVVVFPQSLISLHAPKGRTFRLFNAKDHAGADATTSAFMEPLTQQRYEEVLAARGATIPPQQQMASLPQGSRQEPWVFKHFGALGLGTNYVVARDQSGAQWVLRVQVVNWPARPVEVERIDERQDGQTVMTAHDSQLVVELPGTVADGWHVEHATGYLTLTRLEPVGANRVRLVLARDARVSAPAATELAVSAGSVRNYRFKLNVRPVPAC